MAKRRRGGDDGRRSVMERKHLYLVLDDNPFGYSIRKISLPPPTSRPTSRQTRSSKDNASAPGKGVVRSMPRPIIRLESRRGLPLSLAAIGTKIVMTQCLNPFIGPCGDLLIPIYDVRSGKVAFGPGKFSDGNPINIPIGDELFVLNSGSFLKLSFESHRPDYDPSSWLDLPRQPFPMSDVTSYTVHPDGKTILVSTDVWPGDPCPVVGTFTFDTRKCKWEKKAHWALPFTGRAYYVECLEAFVGLTKDPATQGQLACCNDPTTCPSDPGKKLCKEKLFSDDPAETHVSARLLNTGRGGGSEFCLVQCVCVKSGKPITV